MKKATAALFIVCLTFGLIFLPVLAAQNDKEKASAEPINLKLGDYIILGNYNNEPILWRYVSKDENGILMLSDRVFCLMAFGKKENNCWSDSYIRKWLNSSLSVIEEEGFICRNLVTHDKEEPKGFLHSDYFTDSQKSVIKPVTQRNLLAQGFSDKMPRGGSYEAWSQFSFRVVDPDQNGYYEIAYELLTDKVFCLDIKQMWDVYQNKETLGNYYETTYIDKDGKKSMHIIGYVHHMELQERTTHPILVILVQKQNVYCYDWEMIFPVMQVLAWHII